MLVIAEDWLADEVEAGRTLLDRSVSTSIIARKIVKRKMKPVKVDDGC
jgi:hypothetical protein